MAMQSISGKVECMAHHVRAIANGSYPATTMIGEVSSRDLATIAPSATVDEVLRLMHDKAIHYLAVVENSQPVGIVSISDVASQQESDSPVANVSDALPNR